MVRDERSVGVTLALLIPFAVGSALVPLRGEVSSSVVALVLACTVIVGCRLGRRPGGVASALMAALTFDFLFTEPYRSLKIANADDVLVTLALLAVGLLVGSIAGTGASDRELMRRRYRASASVTRVLAVVQDGGADDVELAVRAELGELLGARDCWFTTEPVAVPELVRESVWVPGTEVAPEGFTLPASGVAIPVGSGGQRLGSLVCLPTPGFGVSTASRRSAYALADVLALARRAASTTA